jgi:hypothetical protein
MSLTPEQEERIMEVVDAENFSIASLREDLVDHLCCVVEYKIKRGSAFDIALKEALHELAPNGLKRIEEETFFLLNSAKIISMKKIMYAIGLVSAMTVCIGWTFKILHWKMGPELSSYGIMGFFVFLSMIAIDNYKYSLNKALSEKLKIILGLLSALVLGTSIIFKLMHLSGADLLLLLGACLFSFGFLPFLFFTMYKKSLLRN